MSKNPNHHNFIATPEQTEYLRELAIRELGADFSLAKSEIFRKIIREHQEGLQYLTPTSCTLLTKLGDYYQIKPAKFLEKLLEFIALRKPNIKALNL